MSETRIPVGGERPYEVIVGTGVLGALPGPGRQEGARRWPSSTPSGLGAVARPACRVLADAGFSVAVD